MGSFIIATEPLEPALAKEVLPTGRMCFNDRNLLWYWRLDDEGRMVFGGRKRLGARVARRGARLPLPRRCSRCTRSSPACAVERAWGGNVALTLDRLPHCGRIDGLWYATGCNGSGVALNTWLGHRMAGAHRAASRSRRSPSCAHRPIPLHALRRAWLPAVSAWFRFQDRRA